jgi:hypothetical protein
VRSLLVLVVACVGCRHEADHVKAAPEVDARPPEAAVGPACLRQETCGQWQGCVLARPQPVPFVAHPGDAPITTGSWYRFDWSDRPEQLGSRQRVCVGDAGRCFDALRHQIPCLPMMNLVEPDYRCELMAGECRRLALSPTGE